MAYFAPGNRSVTACAMTCAVECRSTSRPSSDGGVTIATLASCSIGRLRSYHSPGPSSKATLAASAARARPCPIDAAISPAVTPCSCSRVEPSGSVIVIVMAFLGGSFGRRRVPAPTAARSRIAKEIDAQERAQLPEHRGRGRVAATGQHGTREVIERLEGAWRVEVVVDRGAHPLGVGTRVGAVGALRRGDEPVQERGAVVEVGVVPLETRAVVVTHEREADGARVGDLQQVADEDEVAERLRHLLAVVAH